MTDTPDPRGRRKPTRRKKPNPTARHAREDDAVADLLGPADAPPPAVPPAPGDGSEGGEQPSAVPPPWIPSKPAKEKEKPSEPTPTDARGVVFGDEVEVHGLRAKAYQPEASEPVSSLPEFPDHPSAFGEAEPTRRKRKKKPEPPPKPAAEEGQSVRVTATADDAARAAAEAEAAREAAIDPTRVAPSQRVAERGSTVPWLGVAAVAVVAAGALFQFFQYRSQTLPDEIIAAEKAVGRAEAGLANANVLLAQNMNPDLKSRKETAVAAAERELTGAREALVEAEEEYRVRLLAYAERWREGGFGTWFEEYYVLLGAALTGLAAVGPLTASFGFFAAEEAGAPVTGVAVVAALGWATASLLLALVARWTIRAPWWLAKRRPPFGKYDRLLGVEWPWVAFAVRLIPFVPSLPFDLAAGLFAVSKRWLFVAFAAGSVIVTAMWAGAGAEAKSVLAVRLGEVAPSAATRWVWCGGGFAILALRLVLSPPVRETFRGKRRRGDAPTQAVEGAGDDLAAD